MSISSMAFYTVQGELCHYFMLCGRTILSVSYYINSLGFHTLAYITLCFFNLGIHTLGNSTLDILAFVSLTLVSLNMVNLTLMNFTLGNSTLGNITLVILRRGNPILSNSTLIKLVIHRLSCFKDFVVPL